MTDPRSLPGGALCSDGRLIQVALGPRYRWGVRDRLVGGGVDEHPVAQRSRQRDGGLEPAIAVLGSHPVPDHHGLIGLDNRLVPVADAFLDVEAHREAIVGHGRPRDLNRIGLLYTRRTGQRHHNTCDNSGGRGSTPNPAS